MTFDMENLGGDDTAIQSLRTEAKASTTAEGVLSTTGSSITTNRQPDLGTVLAIHLDGPQADSLGRPLLARLSQKGYSVHWSTLQICQLGSASDLLGSDQLVPDLIVIETQQVDSLLRPECQRVLVALNIDVIPTVVLTHAPPLPLTVAALQNLGIIHTWSGPIAEDLTVLKQLEVYVKLGQRAQSLVHQKQVLMTSLQQRDRALKNHYMIEMIMSQKQQRLEHLAYIDGLTQIPNRRYLDATLTQEWQRSQREGTPLAVIICDVDHFKRYNDTYGHPTGDHCLQKIATAVAETIKRPGDFVGRYGGEEFAVVLPNTDLEGAQRVGASIQANIKVLHLAHRTSEVKPYITLSLGIASIIPKRHLSMERLTTLADKALYRAKLLGRNQIAVYSATDLDHNPDASTASIPAAEGSLKSVSA
ncbi:MAG: diguanylate cyclase [Cyanobacteria bacterium P01_A01_bin.123]